AKFFKGTAAEEQLKSALLAEPGDLLLFVADELPVVYDTLGALRNRLGKELDLIDESQFAFVWITDWPWFEYDEEEERYVPAHPTTTRPEEVDVEPFEAPPEKVYADAYDLSLNGYEIGAGSIRIHTREPQEKMFAALGFSTEEAVNQVGFLLDDLEYGF